MERYEREIFLAHVEIKRTINRIDTMLIIIIPLYVYLRVYILRKDGNFIYSSK